MKLSDKKVDMVYNVLKHTNPKYNQTKIKLSYVWDLHGPRGFGRAAGYPEELYLNYVHNIEKCLMKIIEIE